MFADDALSEGTWYPNCWLDGNGSIFVDYVEKRDFPMLVSRMSDIYNKRGL